MAFGVPLSIANKNHIEFEQSSNNSTLNTLKAANLAPCTLDDVDMIHGCADPLIIKGHFTQKYKRAVAIAFSYLSLVEKTETIQVHFTLEDEDLKAQRNHQE